MESIFCQRDLQRRRAADVDREMCARVRADERHVGEESRQIAKLIGRQRAQQTRRSRSRARARSIYPDEMKDRETELFRGSGDKSDGANPEASAARIFAFLSSSRVAAVRAAMSASSSWPGSRSRRLSI